MANGQNIFDAFAVNSDLQIARAAIRRVVSVASGTGHYPRGEPVPDLRQLRRREAELSERLRMLLPATTTTKGRAA
jgi:hypothetical protein